MSKTKRLTLTTVMIALGTVIGILEANFLNFNVIPGSKIGLSNIVCLITLYLFDFKTALCVNSARAIFVGLMYSGPSSLIYSFTASVVSVVVMSVAKNTFKDNISAIGVSVAGAFFHNLTQVLVAMIISGSVNMIYYFSYLAFVSVVTGIFTGAVTSGIINRIKKDLIL